MQGILSKIRQQGIRCHQDSLVFHVKAKKKRQLSPTRHSKDYEVFVSTRENYSVIFNEKVGYALLGLAQKIVYIGLGDDPFPCYFRKILYLDSDSKVHKSNLQVQSYRRFLG